MSQNAIGPFWPVTNLVSPIYVKEIPDEDLKIDIGRSAKRYKAAYVDNVHAATLTLTDPTTAPFLLKSGGIVSGNLTVGGTLAMTTPTAAPFLPKTGGTVSGNLTVGGTLAMTDPTAAPFLLKNADVDMKTHNISNVGTINGQSLDDFASKSSLALYAPLESPDLTGTPTAPTAAPLTDTTQLATTSFVTSAVAPYFLADGTTAATGDWNMDSHSITGVLTLGLVDEKNNVCIGNTFVRPGDHCVQIGATTTVTATEDIPEPNGVVVIGPGATGYEGGVTIGRGATVSSLQSVAIGAQSVASGADYAVVVGTASTASGNQSIVLGSIGTASGANAITIGSGNNATDDTCLIGHGSIANIRATNTGCDLGTSTVPFSKAYYSDSVFIQDTGAVPSSNPASGGVLYTEAGALKYRGSGGTITTVAVA